jgi:hypothetical protein
VNRGITAVGVSKKNRGGRHHCYSAHLNLMVACDSHIIESLRCKHPHWRFDVVQGGAALSPAEAFGQAIAAERPDIKKRDAKKLVDEALEP